MSFPQHDIALPLFWFYAPQIVDEERAKRFH